MSQGVFILKVSRFQNTPTGLGEKFGIMTHFDRFFSGVTLFWHVFDNTTDKSFKIYLDIITQFQPQLSSKQSNTFGKVSTFKLQFY